jgi:putative hydrolase of the HAD superfamily
MFTDLKPKIILFDFYKTLLDIWTDEERPEVWDNLARYLCYQGLSTDAVSLKQTYFSLAKRGVEQSKEAYPEINVFEIFRKILVDIGFSGTDELIISTTRLFRILSMLHFELFPDTLPTLRFLQSKYKLGLITDAQRIFLEPEIRITGIQPLFDVIIVSSDYSFHKPDPRMFKMALEQLGTNPTQALFVGDSWHRDILGAQSVGIKTILINRKNSFNDFKGSPAPDGIITSLDELRNGYLAYLEF